MPGPGIGTTRTCWWSARSAGGRRFIRTQLTPNEQYTHITLWSLLSSPLLIGCDMTQMDDFTLSLLTNDEVIAVNQDPLGKPAARISQTESGSEIWARDLEDGSKAVGLFNRSELPAEVTVKWADLHLEGDQKVRDLWRQKELGMQKQSYTATVPPWCCVDQGNSSRQVIYAGVSHDRSS